MRFLEYYESFAFWSSNSTDGNSTDFDSNLVPAEDVSVDAVLTSIYFNTIVFVILMITYEGLRRLLPAVYSSRKRMIFVRQGLHSPDFKSHRSSKDERSHNAITEQNPVSLSNSSDDDMMVDHLQSPDSADPFPGRFSLFRGHSSATMLPDDKPLDWLRPVFGVPWAKIRKSTGLDSYFFLRYIRMNVRITAVSTFWFFLILVPIYYTGKSNQQYAARGWYHISASNIDAHSPRMWAPVVFAYLFSAFIIFVIKQEYKHFLELRQDFLARGSEHVHPQHHYSLIVENIPYELRSERALYNYFDHLFPGRIHSTSIVLRVPDLEEASNRCIRTCRRLEKSIAFLHATGTRPSHIVGRGRMSLMGVEMPPLDITLCTSQSEPVLVALDEDLRIGKQLKGTRVDSISYYTHELAEHSRALFEMQQRKMQIAASGNRADRVNNWLDLAFRQASVVASRIMEDSMQDNALVSPTASFDPHEPSVVPQAEKMTSKYGSFNSATFDDPSSSREPLEDTKRTRLVASDYVRGDYRMHKSDDDVEFPVPFGRELYRSAARRWAGRLGLDFFVAGMQIVNKQLDVTLEGVIGSTMSSTGFVTFLDLSSTTCAASAQLTVKANTLDVKVAPEPREILWNNAQVPRTTQVRRETVTNFFLTLGAILWSFPLAAIQAFAKAEFLAQIPGMEWILTLHGGKVSSFVNGYLPVVALLCLISILPLLFEFVGTQYERRKTFSDVQASMLSRYFYYQIANIYVSVTAGSILKSLADILNHPSKILDLLGESLPTMVGYFIALLVTKIMAGLPMIFLRFGALSRMLLLRLLSSEKKLTQRELDWVYRLENVQYGWEFPTQLLVVVIVFTYAIICPVILPFGLLYFVGALIVYKKQILYVYSPVYESGGAMFPLAVQRTLFGLVCGQLTLLGYTVTRGCYYQPAALFLLPLLTLRTMNYFEYCYAEPSTRLSLERARAQDRAAPRGMSAPEVDGLEDPVERGIEQRRRKFDKNSYRQPVLTELSTQPWMYRRGQEDDETAAVRDQLRRINRTHLESQASEGVTL